MFVLGFISAKAESVIVILCRHPCANTPVNKDMNWDSSKWDPLIVDRSFSSWLVQAPSAQDISKARKISPSEMTKLEELWRETPTATVDDLDKPDLQESIPHVALRYEDGYEYQRCFGPLVMYEAEYSRKQKESQTQTNVSVTWDMGLSRRQLVSFFLQNADTSGTRAMVGDEMVISYEGPENPRPTVIGAVQNTVPGKMISWSAVGYVIKIPDSRSEETTLELQVGASPPAGITSGFTIKFLWSGVTFERIQKSLKEFATEETSVSGYLYHKLLGHEVKNIVFGTSPPADLSVPGIAELNPSQMEAVTSVLKHPLSLIQGPPGTGKTVVSTTIVYHIHKQTNEAVLVCAPSNVAADQLADKLLRTGLQVVRLVAKSRETILSDTAIKGITLGELMMSSDETPDELKKLQQLKNDIGELSERDRTRYFKLLRKTELDILRRADVVVCTCSAAGDPRLRKLRFRTVLIDESTQATEPECLIPIVHGCKQLVLVGDHQQLGPVVGCKAAANAGLSKSLFERLISLGHRPIRLTVQYRMHPCLSDFPSNMFYDGSLQNGITQQARMRPEMNFPWPVPETPMMFWSILGQEEISSSGTSYLNRSEASNCERVVTRLFQAGVEPSQIGIITPYEGQRTYLNQHMIMSGTMDIELYRQVEVESVDAFQGREKDYIIVSCVRSNEHQGIGFLSDYRRLNVALTRAKYGLVLLGNPRVLSKNLLWLHLLTHFREKGCLVEGVINQLRPSAIQLSKPRQLRKKILMQPPADGGVMHGQGQGVGGGPMNLPGMPPMNMGGAGQMPPHMMGGGIPGMPPHMSMPMGMPGMNMNGFNGQFGGNSNGQPGYGGGPMRGGPPLPGNGFNGYNNMNMNNNHNNINNRMSRNNRYVNDTVPHDETMSERETSLESDFLHDTESEAGLDSTADLESQLGDPLDMVSNGMPIALSRVAHASGMMMNSHNQYSNQYSGYRGELSDGEETVQEYDGDNDSDFLSGFGDDDDDDDVVSNIRGKSNLLNKKLDPTPAEAAAALQASQQAAKQAASIFNTTAKRAAEQHKARKLRASVNAESEGAARSRIEERQIGSSFGDRLNKLIAKTDGLGVSSGSGGSGGGSGFGVGSSSLGGSALNSSNFKSSSSSGSLGVIGSGKNNGRGGAGPGTSGTLRGNSISRNGSGFVVNDNDDSSDDELASIVSFQSQQY